MLEENQNESGALDFEPRVPARLKALVERFKVCWEVDSDARRAGGGQLAIAHRT